MLEPLTVRNLTTQPLTIEVVERHEAPNPKQLPPNERAQIGEAQTHTRKDVDIRIEPFTTLKTDVEATGREPGEILRLTLHGEGTGRWKIEVPTPSTAFKNLVSLADQPEEYTAMYSAEPPFLAVMEISDMACWMKKFADETSLSALSIPGTHNSPTYYKALPSVRCQAVGPKAQLENGVRFFDVRVQPANPGDPKDDGLILVHGAFPISLTGSKRFRGLLNVVEDFLQEHPSETLILSMKREGTGNATDQHLSTILKDHYITDPEKWYTEPRIPTLSEVRGKIVLLRRFALADELKAEHHGRGWGLDAECWAYNSSDCTHGDVRVQDFCEVLETAKIEAKIGFCCEHFARAARVVDPGPGSPLYLNFLSAANFWRVGCWPDRIAARLNPAVRGFLCERFDVGEGGLGIVVCDWVGRGGNWDLVRTVVAMNGGLLVRQKNAH